MSVVVGPAGPALNGRPLDDTSVAVGESNAMDKATTLRLLVCTVICCSILVPLNSNGGPPPQCFQVEVIYEGREFLYFEGGFNYYRWHYRVVGDSCITNALSNWMIGVCDELIFGVSDVSTMSVDQSDPANGDTTYYGYEVGWDPNSGLLGVKWEHVSGNELDTTNEYDTFSFISPGLEKDAEVKWVAKDGRIYEGATTIGPGCEPVPVERSSWGRLRALYR